MMNFGKNFENFRKNGKEDALFHQYFQKRCRS